jgi:hypothetical protein
VREIFRRDRVWHAKQPKPLAPHQPKAVPAVTPTPTIRPVGTSLPSLPPPPPREPRMNSGREGDGNRT